MPLVRPLLCSALLSAALAVGCGGGGDGSNAPAPVVTDGGPATLPPPAATTSRADDWTRFGYDAARTNDAPSGLSVSVVRRLAERRVRLRGTVDSSPIYLSRARVRGRMRPLLVMTTTYGRTLGVNPRSGATLWTFTPRSYPRLAGSAQITTATPVADPTGRYVYASSPDGLIHKLRVSNGSQVRSRAWPASVTRDPSHEKIASALNLSGRYLLVTTGGYLGDLPPYQGKVLAIDRRSGRVAHVLNSLCSNRRRIINPSSCGGQQSAIWGRAGAVVDPTSHRIYVTSSNGPFDGRTNWADSVLELSPGAVSLLRHWTPTTQRQLAETDSDLGATSPALLPDPNGTRTRFLLQGGKDAKLRLLDLATSLFGVTAAAGRRLGGEAQEFTVVGDTTMFTAPAVLHRPGLTEAFVATGGGTAAYRLSGGRLGVAWQNRRAGTSPVLAGDLLWVYDPNGGLNVYRASDGSLVRRLSAPSGHWNSPIVTGGRAFLPSGDANNHATQGTLSIYRVP